MVELKAPVHTKPPKPIRKHYVHQEGDAVPGERAQTTDKYRADGITPNETIIDEYEFKEAWNEYGKDKEQWKKRQRDWTENNARAYHLVLLHCPPGLITELQNHSTWIAGQQAQDCIALLLMGLEEAGKPRGNPTMVLIVRDREGYGRAKDSGS